MSTSSPAPGMTVTTPDLEERLHASATDWRERLVALSHSLHAEPELAMQEHRSCAKVAELMAAAGFDVDVGVGGLPTAISATKGTGELVIAFCAEYDALPGMGHACGHNVNGAAAVGAAIALAEVADDLDLTVRLIGTPGEEGEGGKVYLLEAGIFDDVAAAAMAHAHPRDTFGATSLALSCWDVSFHGRPSHAAAAPWRGINALDAMTLSYTAIGMLRQQLPPGSVVSLSITEGGGPVNVIPDLSRAQLEVRAPTLEQLREVQSRVRACLEAGAVATGAELEVTPHGKDFAELRQDEYMSHAYAAAARRLGRDPFDATGTTTASTDMGNVSHVLPSVHPTIGYETQGSTPHTASFADHGCSPSADRAITDGAVALAGVGVALAT
ncbi:MAG: amidohydrolase, partial [Nocardioidaceae bacterium]|nr:amidohydrolase [Nocardioidaceae bacterium]